MEILESRHKPIDTRIRTVKSVSPDINRKPHPDNKTLVHKHKLEANRMPENERED